jgi:ribosome-associated protein
LPFSLAASLLSRCQNDHPPTKAQKFRSLEKNRTEALRRLEELIEGVAAPPKARRATRPTRASVARRLEGKARRASIKATRGRVSD